MKASWEMTSLDKLQSSLADAKNSLDDVNTKLRKITGREETYRSIYSYFHTSTYCSNSIFIYVNTFRHNTDSKMETPLPRRISRYALLLHIFAPILLFIVFYY